MRAQRGLQFDMTDPMIVMLGRGVGGPSNSTSYGNESFVRRRVINTLPRDSSLMDIAKLTKDRLSTSVVLRMMPFSISAVAD